MLLSYLIVMVTHHRKSGKGENMGSNFVTLLSPLVTQLKIVNI